MLAGITIFIDVVLVSPFFSKYYLILVAIHAVIKSFIVQFCFFEAPLISWKLISVEVAHSLLPDSYLLPLLKGLISCLSENYLMRNLTI